MRIRNHICKNPNGFTLIEMTVAVSVGLMVSGISLVLINSQLTSYRILKSQNFLVAEAPHINNSLTQIVSRASFFRMYTDINDAISSRDAVISNGKVLALMFTSTDESEHSFGVIEFDENNNRLEYYHVSSMAELAVSSPNWTISSRVSDATFFVENGVLRIRISGSNGEEITYSTTTLR